MKGAKRCSGIGRQAIPAPNGIGHQCPVCGLLTIPYPFAGSVRVHNDLRFEIEQSGERLKDYARGFDDGYRAGLEVAASPPQQDDTNK